MTRCGLNVGFRPLPQTTRTSEPTALQGQRCLAGRERLIAQQRGERDGGCPAPPETCSCRWVNGGSPGVCPRTRGSCPTIPVPPRRAAGGRRPPAPWEPHPSTPKPVREAWSRGADVAGAPWQTRRLPHAPPAHSGLPYAASPQPFPLRSSSHKSRVSPVRQTRALTSNSTSSFFEFRFRIARHSMSSQPTRSSIAAQSFSTDKSTP